MCTFLFVDFFRFSAVQGALYHSWRASMPLPLLLLLGQRQRQVLFPRLEICISLRPSSKFSNFSVMTMIFNGDYISARGSTRNGTPSPLHSSPFPPPPPPSPILPERSNRLGMSRMSSFSLGTKDVVLLFLDVDNLNLLSSPTICSQHESRKCKHWSQLLC